MAPSTANAAASGSTPATATDTCDFDTRVGTIDLAIPKLRSGSYFPDWLLERRKRAERALTSVVATCYLLGVSTRRMEKLVESLGITSLSKSQVSMMARDLDAQVEAFRTRPLDQGPYAFVAADALVLKVRENGRVINVHCLVATGVNADGYREILGVQVTSGEDGAGWLAFFRDLVARGLSGVQLVTSDAHAGLVAPRLVDEKSQMQAIDRTAPILPIMPTTPARRTHDYVRHGTTSLFAAFDIGGGSVIAQHYRRHRHQEFLRFLKLIDTAVPKTLDLHLVLDNYATHKTPRSRNG